MTKYEMGQSPHTVTLVLSDDDYAMALKDEMSDAKPVNDKTISYNGLQYMIVTGDRIIDSLPVMYPQNTDIKIPFVFTGKFTCYLDNGAQVSNLITRFAAEGLNPSFGEDNTVSLLAKGEDIIIVLQNLKAYEDMPDVVCVKPEIITYLDD